MGSARCGVDGTIRRADPSFAALHGFRPDELLGRSLAGLIAPHCRGELGIHLRIASARSLHAFPTVHRARGGDEFPVEVRVAVEGRELRYEVRGHA